MSIVEEFNALHIGIKRIVLSIAVLFPFWYAVIIILSPFFNNHKRVELPFIIAFCLCFTQFITQLMSIFEYARYIEVKDNIEVSADMISALAAIMCIFMLSLFSLVWRVNDWGVFSLVISIHAFTIIELIFGLLLPKKPYINLKKE